MGGRPTKFIFLDIDGVLVNRESLRRASGLHAEADPQCVARLNRITDATNAAIVVSSTWRMIGIGKMKDKLNEWGVTGKVAGITPDLTAPVPGSSLVTSPARGVEIVAWMCEWKSAGRTIDAFVILDDDSDMGHLIGHLVKTTMEFGLMESDVEKAITVLERP